MLHHEWDASQIVLIITAVSGLITSTIAAFKANSGKRVAEEAKQLNIDNSTKLDEVKDRADTNQQTLVNSQARLEKVHELVNGTTTELKNDLMVCAQRNEYLNRVIDDLAKKLPVGSLEETHKNVFRRSTDSVGK